MKNDIDFVIMWVDGSDIKWQKEKNMYLNNNSKDIDSRVNRYRDWETLKYWFRGVEKYASWVNKIHFVTWGHIPEWLNTENDKINIVKHEDYIPKNYLPTFNSHTIELNLYRIKDLSENFVLFNDDMFIIDKTKKEDFFCKNLPCDSAILSPIMVYDKDDFAKVSVNNMAIINTYFSKDCCIKKNFLKWINLKYGKQLLRTICLLPWKHFTGFYDIHLPTSLKKSTFKEVWSLEREMLDKTSSSRFRNNSANINQWIIRYWQICKGEFYPRSIKYGYKFQYEENNDDIYKAIINQKYKMICLNDNEANYNFEIEKEKTIEAFEKILPEKSKFEK